MKKYISIAVCSFLLILPNISNAQIDEDKMGAWYMYFFNTTFDSSSWGFQGDIQFRNWNLGGDLEQLLLRGGVTYKPKAANIKFTLGYGNVTTGTYGNSSRTSGEQRIYQEALFPVSFTNRFNTTHRFRYEQRFVENQDLRTRYRYNLFLNIPLNQAEMKAKTIYLALYNEVFINGQRAIGNGNQVELFDRNRLYGAIGYMKSKSLKFQAGFMNQTTDNWSKNQLQISAHHQF